MPHIDPVRARPRLRYARRKQVSNAAVRESAVRERRRSWIMGAVLTAASFPVWSQPVYQCSANGQTWLSRTPCPAPGGTVLRKFGPVPERPTFQTPRRLGDPRPAEAHVQYLSVECARISEGIRTGPSRGVSSSVIAELRQEYQRKCQDDDNEARNQARQDEKRVRDERKAARKSEQMAKADQARQSAQCDEMLRTLAGKRRRLETLTPGERDDLARFQARYDERCGR